MKKVYMIIATFFMVILIGCGDTNYNAGGDMSIDDHSDDHSENVEGQIATNAEIDSKVNIDNDKATENNYDTSSENTSKNNGELQQLQNDYDKLLDENKELKDEIENLKQQIYNIEHDTSYSLGVDNQIQEEISEINYRNLSIREVKDFYSDGIEHRSSKIIDNIGNSYDGYTFMSAGDFMVAPEGSVVYRNDDQYAKFYGKVIIAEYEKDAEDCGWIKIYGDNILLFDSGVMGRGIIPVDFNLDISNYSEIRIDFKNGTYSSQCMCIPYCYLVDTYFVEL